MNPLDELKDSSQTFMMIHTSDERKYVRKQTIIAILEEVDRARTKFPGNRFLLAALTEEVGELAQAILQRKTEEIYKEAMQVACVAIRIMEEGDSAFDDLTDAESKK